ncbi:phosphatase PAP2 family protein [Rhodovulum euryhalinum]|uniref:Lipid A 4'-phosphatase n=1 Tax=Rhodovulum euryhalinum TaxID=35805 RepID=A0A4R2KGZ9_9RHOB|nr:phosphatase PAP2 family protein [Rhodovulum euryhalinum]TCO71587.1 lipid A 4'-phosphatase [Rhodovulum euryhalinum]
MSVGRVFLVVWLAASLVFAVLPGIDLAVARVFFVEGEGFVLGDVRQLQLIREGLWNLANLVGFVALAFGIHALLSRRTCRVPGRVWGYAVTLILVVPIGIVNGILKEFWGRARPDDVTEFGGPLAFTPPWEIAGQCARNCSFVSGEAASAATMAILIGLFAWNAVPGGRRPYLVAVLVAIALGAGMLRVSFGRHFLSDVLWADIIVLTMAWALARAFRLRDVIDRITFGAVAADARTAAHDLAAVARAFSHFARALARELRAGSGGRAPKVADAPESRDVDATPRKT